VVFRYCLHSAHVVLSSVDLLDVLLGAALNLTGIQVFDRVGISAAVIRVLADGVALEEGVVVQGRMHAQVLVGPVAVACH